MRYCGNIDRHVLLDVVSKKRKWIIDKLIGPPFLHDRLVGVTSLDELVRCGKRGVFLPEPGDPSDGYVDVRLWGGGGPLNQPIRVKVEELRLAEFFGG